MKAIVLRDFGGPENVVVEERERPTAAPGEVLVAVAASGVCHHDVMHRAGRLPGARAGVILGHETAGTIVAVGDGVPVAAVGRRVVVYQRRFCGVCRACTDGRQDLCHAQSRPSVDAEGGAAQFVAVPWPATIPVPDAVSDEAAALASCPIATSLRALTTVGGLRPGDDVLITGASGGLGSHQIQLARAFGANVIAVTSSAQKRERLERLGAQRVIVAEDGRFGAAVWAATDKRGVDVAVDNVGPTLPEVLRCTSYGGRVVALGNIAAETVPVAPGLLIGRRITLAGSGMGTLDDVRRALALIAQGIVQPIIEAVLPFGAAADAHRLLDERRVTGRVVLSGWPA